MRKFIQLWFALALSVLSIPAAATTTWDPSAHSSSITLSSWLGHSNLTATLNAGVTFPTALSLPAVARHTGKYYFEVMRLPPVAGNSLVGVANGSQSTSNYIGSTSSTGTGMKNDGQVFGATGAGCAWNGSYSTVGVAVDLDNNRLWFNCLGTWYGNGGSPNPATNTSGIDISALNDGVSVMPAVTLYNTAGSAVILNTGNYGFFRWAIPSGFSGWDANGSQFGTNNAGPGTFDSGNCVTGATLSGGNLTFTIGGTTGSCLTQTSPTDAKYTGKLYFEINFNISGGGAIAGPGISSAQNFYAVDGSSYLGTDGGEYSITFAADGHYMYGNSPVAASLCLTPNIGYQGIAVNLTTNEIWCTLDGSTWNNGSGANPATDTGGFALPSGMNTLGIIAGANLAVSSPSNTATVNLGATRFNFACPSGFSSWDAGLGCGSLLSHSILMGFP
jgi:hypothetical protein